MSTVHRKIALWVLFCVRKVDFSHYCGKISSMRKIKTNSKFDSTIVTNLLSTRKTTDSASFLYTAKKKIIHVTCGTYLTQWSQNVGAGGPHHKCHELIVSSSLNQPMAVERGRSHELMGSMVGAASSHVLEPLI